MVEIIVHMNNLPNLPTKHNQREAKVGLEFRKLFETFSHLLPSDCQFELKQTEDTRFYLSNIKAKQRKTNKGLIRLSIATEGSADYMYVTTIPLFIVIKFKKNIYVIPIENIDFNMKSLTETDCNKISIIKI